MGKRKQNLIARFAGRLAAGGLVVGGIAATSGCTLFSAKNETSQPSSPGFFSNVSTNANEMPLPVEINNDIGKIMAGAGHFESTGGGSGKVNVNVNVNFNGGGPGGGWTKTVSESNGDSPAVGAQSAQSAQVAQSARLPLKARGTASVAGKVMKREAEETYVVKPGDTLMKISFEKYGNVYRWREILSANQDKIANYSALKAGTELRINGIDYVVVERNGKPYLIVRNDTLGKISKQIYGVNAFWRELWKNNPQLIHDPNKIYAGFTLYYRDPSEVRQPASHKK